MEFQIFTSRHKIKHVTTAPEHPSSNGLVESYEHIPKEEMQKMNQWRCSLNLKLSQFLLSYNLTPQMVTGMSPDEVLIRGKIKPVLKLVISNKTSIWGIQEETMENLKKKTVTKKACLFVHFKKVVLCLCGFKLFLLYTCVYTYIN